MNNNTQTNMQVGGSHYTDMSYQPIEFITKMKLSFSQGCIVKYVSRYKRKNGVEDLRKALHFCELAMAFEDYSKLRLFWRNLRWFETDDNINEYTLANDIRGIELHCISCIVYCKFEDAVDDLKYLISKYTLDDPNTMQNTCE